MNKVWRNRAILSIVLVLIALAGFAIQHYGIYDIKGDLGFTRRHDPMERLEESGFADLLHFGYVESRWSSNMVVHVAAILYSPDLDFSDCYVVIETKGETTSYIVNRGDYVWNPEEKESPDIKWSHWTIAKYKHYSSNALFPPGKGERAQKAVEVLVNWMNEERKNAQDKAVRDWLYVVIEEACQYEDWDFIEIDLFNIAEHPIPNLVVTRNGEPDIMAGYEATYTNTIFIYRRSSEFVEKWIDERWMRIAWHLDDLREEGELSDERVMWMISTGQMQMQPAMTWFGPIPYAYDQYGFNHPWQGREINQ